MRALKRILMGALMAAMLSIPALTQEMAFGQKNDNRPPKETPKIKEREKPPPRNSNNGQNNSNRKKP